MLIVKLQRRLMAESQTIGLLLIAAASSVVITLLNLSFSHLLWPTPPSTPFLTNAARFSVGDFIGILTVAPSPCCGRGRTWGRRNRSTKDPDAGSTFIDAADREQRLNCPQTGLH